jgi:hypothetical protein
MPVIARQIPPMQGMHERDVALAWDTEPLRVVPLPSTLLAPPRSRRESMRSMRVSLTALGLGILVSGLASAEQQDVIAVSALNQDVRVAYDETGQAIMDHIAKAQAAMATSTDFALAEIETGKALALLGSLEHQSPTNRFHDAIAGLLHRHRAKQAKPEDFVPVMGVLNDVEQLDGVEVEDTHAKLERVKGKLEKEPTVDAEADLIDATDDVGYLEIDLPIQETKTRLISARLAESQRDAPNANAALSDALNHTKTWTATVQASLGEIDSTK